MQLPAPSKLMWLLFLGFALSLFYGLGGAYLIYGVSGKADATAFFVMYVGPFNSLVSLGIITGTALIAGYSQHLIPATIEKAFTREELDKTAYFENKIKYYSLKRTVLFASEFIIIGWVRLFSNRRLMVKTG